MDYGSPWYALFGATDPGCGWSMCFLLLYIPKCWPWHLCQFWEKAVLCSLCLHTWALWFKAHICTGKANRNCMKFSLQRIGASSLDGQDCACCEFRTADTVCHSSPGSRIFPSEYFFLVMWHLLKPWKRKNIFKLCIFLFTFLLIYITAREDARVGNSVLDLGEWQSLCI